MVTQLFHAEAVAERTQYIEYIALAALGQPRGTVTLDLENNDHLTVLYIANRDGTTQQIALSAGDMNELTGLCLHTQYRCFHRQLKQTGANLPVADDTTHFLSRHIKSSCKHRFLFFIVLENNPKRKTGNPIPLPCPLVHRCPICYNTKRFQNSYKQELFPMKSINYAYRR